MLACQGTVCPAGLGPVHGPGTFRGIGRRFLTMSVHSPDPAGEDTPVLDVAALLFVDPSMCDHPARTLARHLGMTGVWQPHCSLSDRRRARIWPAPG